VDIFILSSHALGSLYMVRLHKLRVVDLAHYAGNANQEIDCVLVNNEVRTNALRITRLPLAHRPKFKRLGQKCGPFGGSL
jgi:hypothetical protein